MTKKSDDRVTLDRRGFLKGAATGAGAMLINVPFAAVLQEVDLTPFPSIYGNI
jgi:hypothetical protein